MLKAEMKSTINPMQMIDPFYKRISVDFGTEASVGQKISFGDISPLKLNSLQTPITLNPEVIKDSICINY